MNDAEGKIAQGDELCRMGKAYEFGFGVPKDYVNERAEEILGELGKLQKEFEKYGGSTESLRIKADAMVNAVQQHTTRERQMSRALERIKDLEQIEEVPEE